MATANVSDNSQTSLWGSARGIFLGLVWSAVMLIVLGFWVRSKYEGAQKPLTYVFLLVGVAAVVLALWQAFTLWIKKEPAEAKIATLTQQRRIFSLAFMIAGLGLIVCAFLLGFGKKTGGSYGFLTDNIAESIGVLLFGLIALGNGYVLSRPFTIEGTPVSILMEKRPILKVLQIVLGALALASLAYLAWTNRANNAFLNWLPELIALLFMSVLCIACFLWLNTGEFDEFGMRVFVLIFGGAIGSLLFLYSAGRTMIWRVEIFQGGIAFWQGPDAWHGWLCLYLQVFALILMFVSFNLARTDIRTNVNLRRVLYGYNAIVQTLLLAEILVVTTIVVSNVYPFTYDWTKSRGAYTLAESTKNLISGLKQETNVIVLVPQNSNIYKDLHNLLDNCQALNTTKFKVKYFSPDNDPLEYEKLAKTFPKMLPESPMAGVGRGVLLVYGKIPEDDKQPAPPYTFVSDRKLQDFPRQGDKNAKLIFKGEAEIFKELKFLVQDKQKRKIYVLQGDDEPDLNNKDPQERAELRESFANVGIGLLVEKLGADNYDISGLSLSKQFGQKNPGIQIAKEGPDKKIEIPADCDTLVIAGASATFSPAGLEAIERYFDQRNGKLLVFLDVFVTDDYAKLKDSGLEALLRRFGVEVTDEFPLRFPTQMLPDARSLIALAPKKSEHALAREFSKNPILMKKTARVVKPVEQPGRFKAETILQLELSRASIYTLEKKTSVLASAQRYMVEIMRDQAKLEKAAQENPIPVAVAVSEGERPRMVVVGDTEFITNLDIARSPSAATNYSFVVSALEWMGERESIGALPKESPIFTLQADVNTWQMIYLPLWLMLLAMSGLGIGVWIVRRR